MNANTECITGTILADALAKNHDSVLDEALSWITNHIKTF